MFGKTYRAPGKTVGKSHVTVACTAVLLKGEETTYVHVGHPTKSEEKIDLPVSWGGAEFVHLKINVSYKLVQFGGATFANVGTGQFSFSQRWKIYYRKNGLHLHPLQDTKTAPEGEGQLSVEASMGRDFSPIFDTNSFVSVTINLAGGLKSDGVSVGYKGFGITVGKADESFKIGNGLRLVANLKLTGQPTEKTPLKIPTELLKHTVYFDKEGDEHLRTDRLTRLEDKWSDPLLMKSPQIHKAIASGLCPIKLEGFTTTTASIGHNKKLSARRIEEVAKRIRALFPNSATIVFRPKVPHGKSVAKSIGPKADGERRVVLSISERDARSAYDE